MADPAIDLSQVAQTYPALAPHLNNAVAQWGDGPGVLEFYHPDDAENPNKGKITLQFRDRTVSPEQIPDFAAADMLHYLGSADQNGVRVDPQYYSLRQQMMMARTPEQIKADQQNYESEKKTFGESGSYEDYIENNRADGYMRGAAFPQINPEWGGFLTPAQTQIGQQLQQYLKTSPQVSPQAVMEKNSQNAAKVKAARGN